MNSIPTTYRGVRMRSRLEAEVAYLLDAMRCEWEYEPQSFLIPETGDHYLPDFRVGRLFLWVEARGYVTGKGERQISGFRSVLGLDESYLVVHANGTELTEPELFPDGVDHETRSGVGVATCMDCWRGFFYPQDAGWACRWCESESVAQLGPLHLVDGHVHVGEMDLRATAKALGADPILYELGAA